ncbi:ATP-dependent metallopeptidase FtsH/Yme1/Tma family protein, partial [Tepidimonas sp.]|uniref:ATP-dependent metallopeptidase FtsH/Yme1/Tma family protein n=1 Tax=Tepidimonas sp. TaxID=2002775 RepID=UPI002FE1A808
MDKQKTWNASYWLVAFAMLLALQNWWQAATSVQPLPYSELEQALREGRVDEVLVGDQTITGRLKSPDARGKAVIVANRVEP